MKINLYGSNANMAYLIAKFLRRKGQEACVFIDSNPQFKCNLPDWEEGEGKFPEWARTVNVDLKKIFFGKAERNFLQELSNCDVIHVIGEAAIWASFTNKPYLYWSYGFDLDILPFKKGNLKNSLLSSLQRRALAKAGMILYPMPHQTDFVKKLKLKKAHFFLPMVPVDMEKYCRRASAALNSLRNSYDCDFLFLHPSRQEWLRDIPDNKGNDRLFRAFARFVKSGNNAKILAFEKGRDIEESKKMVSSLGINSNVIWLKEQNKDALIDLYSISDIVFDQFNIGSPGLITWEALSVGVPTFVYLKDFWKEYSSELPPIINVSRQEDIFEMICKFSFDKSLRQDVGIRSRNWIAKYFHWEPVTEQYIRFYRDILAIKNA